MINKLSCITIFILALVLPVTASAQVGAAKKNPAYKDDYQITGSVMGPYYDPHSKSYFELRWAKKGRTWRDAYAEARSLTFKDTHGRLAVVRDLETHTFIQNHMRISAATWIGLRYQCGNSSLQWVDDVAAKKSDFTAWHYRWARRDDIRCGPYAQYANHSGDKFVAHMGISYIPLGKNKSSLWQASGPEKGYDFMLVEYPTGKE